VLLAGVSQTANAKTAAAKSVVTRDKVRLAIVGIGNRGWSLIRAFDDTGLVEWVAAAEVDPDGEHCVEPRAHLGNIPIYRDFREMLVQEDKNIDAVVVATPDFSHFPVTLACMHAGKHVFVEKPLAHTFAEVEALIEAERTTGVVTQMGNQGHSGANYFQFKAWREAGVIKDVTRIDAHMNSPRRWHGWDVNSFDTGGMIPPGMDWDLWHVGRPVHDFSERLHPGNWRSWYAYGSGAFGDWAPHILDTCHRFLDLGLPSKIEAVKRDGPSDFIFPQASTIKFSFPTRGEHPPCDITWYDGVDNLPPVPAEESPDAKLQRNGKFIYSDETVFRGGTHSATLRVIPPERMRELGPTLPKFPQKNSDHFANFCLACLGKEEARSPFSVSGPLSQVFILGIIAQRLGGSLEFDRATKSFPKHPIANELLTAPPLRPGWESAYGA
jgi:predicted dehydrogenase